MRRSSAPDQGWPGAVSSHLRELSLIEAIRLVLEELDHIHDLQLVTLLVDRDERDIFVFDPSTEAARVDRIFADPGLASCGFEAGKDIFN